MEDVAQKGSSRQSFVEARIVRQSQSVKMPILLLIWSDLRHQSSVVILGRASPATQWLGEAGLMNCPHRGTENCYVVSRIAVEARGATVLESSTRPCLHWSITRSKSTALPKTVKPWHPSSRPFVPKAFPPPQRKHPILSSLRHAALARSMQNLRAAQRNQTLVVRRNRRTKRLVPSFSGEPCLCRMCLACDELWAAHQSHR